MLKKLLIIILVILTNVFIISSEEVFKTNILFHPDSDEILKKSIPDMEEIYNLLMNNKDYLITLKGFTNSTGDPENELELSIRRSNAIALILNNKGISLSRMKAAGFGSLNLKVKKITEENRRVEVIIYKNKEEIKNIKEIKIDSRKFKLTVTDQQGNYIFANINIKDTDKNNKNDEKYFSIVGPRIIDIPISDKLKFSISSHGYESADFYINKNEEEKQLKLKQAKNNSFIYIKGGKFIMGDTFGNGYKNEKPAHEVEVKDFYIGKYEVTQKEWNVVMDKNPSMFTGDNLPVNNITWYDAVEYCNKRSMKEGLIPYYNITKDKKDPNNKNKKTDKYNWIVECDKSANGYRLPTEAEWEYAARGGNQSNNYIFSGSSIINDITKHIKIKEIRINIFKSKREIINHIEIFQVGELKPNELNIYDMNNNILEWCWDWYDAKYYNKKEKDNPEGNNNGIERVVRGGFQRNFILDCRVSARFNQRPYIPKLIKHEFQTWTSSDGHDIKYYYYFIGFRIVKNTE